MYQFETTMQAHSKTQKQQIATNFVDSVCVSLRVFVMLCVASHVYAMLRATFHWDFAGISSSKQFLDR